MAYTIGVRNKEMKIEDYIIKEPVAQGEVKGFFAQHGKFSAGSGKKYSVAELQGTTFVPSLIAKRYRLNPLMTLTFLYRPSNGFLKAPRLETMMANRSV